jgi:hypothetical protein
VIPPPCLRINGFADGTKKSQAGKISFLHPLLAFPHERPDGCRRCIENVYFKSLYDLPEPVGSGIGWNAFKHERSPTEGQRAVDDIAVTGDPPDVCGTKENIFLLDVKDPLQGLLHKEEISCRGVNDPLRFARASTGVKDEKNVLRIHHLGFTGRLDVFFCHLLVPPQISFLRQGHVDPQSLDDNHLLNAGALLQRLIGIDLVLNDLAASVVTIRGNQKP